MSSRMMFAGLFFSVATGAHTAAVAQPVGTKVEVVGHFTANEDANLGVSGIACSNPMTDPLRVCLVALDEGLSAQLATLTLLPTPKLTIHQTVPLLDKAWKDDPRLKEIPAVSCSEGAGKFNEHDSEGVSFLAGSFIVTGSHGCGRNSHKFKASSFVDVRLAAPSAEQLSGGEGVLDSGALPDWSPRLDIALSTLPDLAASYGQDIAGGNGLSIEGIAAAGGDLFFGLRSPVSNAGAPIVSLSASDLFDNSDAVTAVLHFASLEGLGVRDLALLDASPLRFLVLAGPKDGEEGPFKVFLFSPREGGGQGAVELIDELPLKPGEKAEGILAAARDDKRVSVLVLHDGVVDGDPMIYDLPLPQGTPK